MGKLIVLEGLDGSGKSTQLLKLEENLKAEKVDIRTVSFPEYSEPSCEPVKMYLSGKFGNNPEDVSAYTASLFFAIDRYASFKLHWGEYYNNGGTVLSGRYTTSNCIHQMSKLPEEEWEQFLDWLYDLEYEKVKIPSPDVVFFLDMPLEVSNKLLSTRYEGDESKRDIHESNANYLKMCRKAAYFAANKLGWMVVNCAKDGEPRTIEDIANEILNLTKEVI